jgi:hypothetical protein
LRRRGRLNVARALAEIELRIVRQAVPVSDIVSGPPTSTPRFEPNREFRTRV